MKECVKCNLSFKWGPRCALICRNARHVHYHVGFVAQGASNAC
jgi:hypothetical protein